VKVTDCPNTLGLPELVTDEVVATLLTVVASFAVLLLVSVSPPPDTLAELVTELGALDATFTVSVIGA
jgi:hypothetical protein